MFILSVLNLGMRNGDLTASTKKEQKERQRSRTAYQLMGRLVCRTAFLFLMK
jgi:hypothetical protein